jgi:hypothetical protein
MTKQHYTVNWTQELARTEANWTNVLNTFSAQIPRDEVPVEFIDPRLGLWGWYTKSCFIIFHDEELHHG